ncbi:ferritin-like domain-containing protein [Almyronema epifaneia]|uniref:Ferritin-like domain-containing protein n=1 Tax=Almyronema epifaneia S1 TaxID=2991925 RepID=A0ABW6IF71_9CYAN
MNDSATLSQPTAQHLDQPIEAKLNAQSPTLSLHQSFQQIRDLVQQYLRADILRDRLADLPLQWQTPRPRPWQKIRWTEINREQIIGLEADIFLLILKGAIETETPIRGYTQASRQYLTKLHPAMAEFVGGTVDENGHLVRLGLWELEEKRHTPVLTKLYTQLAGQPPVLKPHVARPYQPTGDPYQDLYRHGLHRVATEYGATCLYLWLMVYATGALRTVLAELLMDEINHMTKFWGFGRWLFPTASLLSLAQILMRAFYEKLHNPHRQGSLCHTLHRMKKVLGWPQWSWQHRLTFLYALGQVMKCLWQWNQGLTSAELQRLLGQPLNPM